MLEYVYSLRPLPLPAGSQYTETGFVRMMYKVFLPYEESHSYEWGDVYHCLEETLLPKRKALADNQSWRNKARWIYRAMNKERERERSAQTDVLFCCESHTHYFWSPKGYIAGHSPDQHLAHF